MMQLLFSKYIKINSLNLIICFSIFASFAEAQEPSINLASPLPNKDIIHTAYLVGDSGGLDTDNPPNNIVLSSLKSIIHKDVNASLYFLGDNIYPAGLRESSTEQNEDTEILDHHIELAESLDNKSYLIPGNHDWAGTTDDYNSMVGMTKYLENNSDKLRLKPSNGCPDPYLLQNK